MSARLLIICSTLSKYAELSNLVLILGFVCNHSAVAACDDNVSDCSDLCTKRHFDLEILWSYGGVPFSHFTGFASIAILLLVTSGRYDSDICNQVYVFSLLQHSYSLLRNSESFSTSVILKVMHYGMYCVVLPFSDLK